MEQEHSKEQHLSPRESFTPLNEQRISDIHNRQLQKQFTSEKEKDEYWDDKLRQDTDYDVTLARIPRMADDQSTT